MLLHLIRSYEKTTEDGYSYKCAELQRGCFDKRSAQKQSVFTVRPEEREVFYPSVHPNTDKSVKTNTPDKGQNRSLSTSYYTLPEGRGETRNGMKGGERQWRDLIVECTGGLVVVASSE